MRQRERTLNFILSIIMTLLCAIWLYPFILVLLNSLKSNPEMLNNIVGLPKPIRFENYINTWNSMNFPRLYFNNIVYTVGSVVGIVFISAIAGYKLSRTNRWYSHALFLVFIMPMMIPFQVIMITVTKLAAMLNLTGNMQGVIIFHWGYGIPLAVFLYHSFVKTIPKELDQSASIDGAGPYRLFFSIIFPLLMPITTTIIIIYSLGIWNEFLLVLLLIGSSEQYMNIPLAISTNFGTYYANWEMALPGMMIGILPAIVFFLLLQKYIIAGMTAGAVKG